MEGVWQGWSEAVLEGNQASQGACGAGGRGLRWVHKPATSPRSWMPCCPS